MTSGCRKASCSSWEWIRPHSGTFRFAITHGLISLVGGSAAESLVSKSIRRVGGGPYSRFLIVVTPLASDMPRARKLLAMRAARSHVAAFVSNPEVGLQIETEVMNAQSPRNHRPPPDRPRRSKSKFQTTPDAAGLVHREVVAFTFEARHLRGRSREPCTHRAATRASPAPRRSARRAAPSSR